MDTTSVETDHSGYNSYYSYKQAGVNFMEPIGPIGLVQTPGSRDFLEQVNKHLVTRRHEYGNTSEVLEAGYVRDDYRLATLNNRSATGEGIAQFIDSVRGHDLFIFTDVMNYSVTYDFYGKAKPMTPDEHFQDLKRLILAASGKGRRINVIMPFLYESRQHRRSSRESLDAAYMLEELETLGVQNVITFDAHDPRVSNSTPISGFENIPIHYQLVQALSNEVEGLDLLGDDVVFVAPDEGAIDRVMYFSSLLEAPLGTFYKLRDFTKVVDGRNPIIAHEFLGDNVEGKDIIVVDDMIASGDSMLDIAKEMKERGARRVIACTTFALFTSGLEKFDQAYKDGYIDHVFSSNLIYRTPELLSREWYHDIDCSRFVALIVDALNHDASISNLINQTGVIKEYLKKLDRER